MFRQLREDIAIVKEKDPAARSSLEILLTYSGLKAVRSYRRAHWFYQHKWFTIATHELHQPFSEIGHRENLLL